jgi:hypothetical protein
MEIEVGVLGTTSLFTGIVSLGEPLFHTSFFLAVKLE